MPQEPPPPTWIERTIREAIERGEFDDLEGQGEPLAALAEPYEENWWVKSWLRRENVNLKESLDDLDDESRERLLATLRRRLRRASG